MRPIKQTFVTIVAVLSLSISTLAQNKPVENKVHFPDNYSAYKEIKTGVISAGHSLHGIIADGPYKTKLNETAYAHYMTYFERFSKGETVPAFPEGSVVTLVQSKNSDSASDNFILVMSKNNEEHQTRGWAWQGFKLPTKQTVVSNAVRSCATCHFQNKSGWDMTFLGAK